jgi:hypothetical protein
LVDTSNDRSGGSRQKSVLMPGSGHERFVQVIGGGCGNGRRSSGVVVAVDGSTRRSDRAIRLPIAAAISVVAAVSVGWGVEW